MIALQPYLTHNTNALVNVGGSVSELVISNFINT